IFANIFKYFYELARDYCFWRTRNLPFFSVAKENCDFIFVALHSGIGAADIIRHHNIASLLAQFVQGVRFQIVRLSSEADHAEQSILGDGREDIASWDQFERERVG